MLIESHSVSLHVVATAADAREGGAINRWLEAQHPRLSPNLTDLTFSIDGVEVKGNLRAVAAV